ncbi:TetR/AcrR family transcriptional regulator [Stenotrophomonas sp. MMGLT7]|uniref:TetR/AcrR family transcriptional regulator n=1 Tax=Stenotrophomonas sp. MMGLT7 TaxID=2901227 RepID=UPI001E2F93B3|nr:TetR/AcrR family transcriptional regulator [Stenotrophomonas sp. MMGLT7]MCD7098099.1 TetR/AcrR family transcriptional regulator [Stenotrophomonas sp. MMGLT7]
MSKKAGAYHHGDLRSALLDAAVKVVEKDGVNALTLRTLASSAGVSSAAPYHHFESREQLLATIAAEGLVGLVSEMRRCSATAANPHLRLEALGRGYVRYALTHRGHFRVMFRPELRERLGKEMNRELGEGLVLLREAIMSCQSAGLAPAGDVNRLILLAWSAVHGACQLWIDGPLSYEGLVAGEDVLDSTVAGTLMELMTRTAITG